MDELDEKIRYIDVQVIVITSEFHVEYFGCGSHKQEITATMPYEDLIELRNTVEALILKTRDEQSKVGEGLDL